MADKARATEAAARNASHGRGGAGNINSRPENVGSSSVNLDTPTLKSNNYTTGRGGTGNIVPNDKSNPAVARAAQDVDTPAAHGKDPKGVHHWGRGGEGNMMHVGEKPRTSSRGDGERPSLVEKGKSFLGIGKKEGEGRKSASPEAAVAVENLR
nr:hypothetical protein B0A51_15942 [Rachicladosporium sp. CCFEE 5018]